MEHFDWGEAIKQAVFKSWLETKGANVKIAVLDSGVDLSHPALRHLDKNGHKLHSAVPGFDLGRLNDFTSLDVADDFPDEGHGTKCISVLAAMPELAFELNGMVPKAEIFLIKITKPGKPTALVAHFLLGVEAALNLGADIIVSTARFSKKRFDLEGIPETEVERVFGKVKQSGTLFINSLPNMETGEPWAGVAQKNFPNRRPEVINVGVLPPETFASLRAAIDAEPGVHLLLNNGSGTLCKAKGGYLSSPLSTSFAACVVGGIAALCISSIKKREGDAYQRRPAAEVFLSMGRNFTPLLAATSFPTEAFNVFATSQPLKAGGV